MQEQSSQFSIGIVKQFFNKIFNGSLRKTHFENLCLSIFGLVFCQSGLISEVARPIAKDGSTSFKHTLKRVGRFLANVRFKPDMVLAIWAVWCARQFFDENDRFLPIAVDWTALPGDYQCLMAAIPCHGRAMPLYFKIATRKVYEQSQNTIEEQFAKKLIKILPKEMKPLIIADRGFGRASLFKFLLELKVDFCIRIKSEVWITLESGKRRKLSRMKVLPERGRWYENITYCDDNPVTGIDLAAAATEDSGDYWFIATTLKTRNETVSWYAKRFRIEEFFKDGKHQLGIADMQTPSRMRIYRLTLVACLSFGFLSITGEALEQHEEIKDKLITKTKTAEKTISRIWLAVRAIRYYLIEAPIWYEVLATISP